MVPKPCCPPKPRPAVPAAPAWADPLAVMAVSGYRSTVITGGAGVAVQAVIPDPKRIAIGFCIENVMAGSAWVGPDQETQAHGWLIAGSVLQNWFTIFDFGPLVPASWWLFEQLGQTYRVIEVYRLQ